MVLILVEKQEATRHHHPLHHHPGAEVSPEKEKAE